MEGIGEKEQTNRSGRAPAESGMFRDPRPAFESAGRHEHMTNDEHVICVRRPARYDATPLADVESAPFLEPMPPEDVEKHWRSILDGDMRVACLNGIVIHDDGMSAIYCDYCRTRCAGTDYCRPRFEHYYICATCGMDMCALCYEEKSEAIALANGAKNWRMREEKLNACRAHGLKHVTEMGFSICDICGEPIAEGRWRRCVVSEDPLETVDLCSACEPTAASARAMDFEHHARGGLFRCDASGFGSMLDWIPVAADAGHGDASHGAGIVLLNLNPDSPSFRHVALAVADDHGRTGFFDMGYGWRDFVDACQGCIAKRSAEAPCGRPLKRSRGVEGGDTAVAAPGCESRSPSLPADGAGDEHRRDCPAGAAAPPVAARRIVRSLLKRQGRPLYYG